MTDVFDFAPRQVVILYVCFRILSDFVQCLEEPGATSSQVYKVFYKFLNLLLGDSKSFMNAIVASKAPHILPVITPLGAASSGGSKSSPAGNVGDNQTGG